MYDFSNDVLERLITQLSSNFQKWNDVYESQMKCMQCWLPVELTWQ